MYDGGPQLRSHQVRTLDDRVDILRRMVWQGDQAFNKRNPPVGGLKDPRMRQIGLEVTRGCPARDDMCELNAIYEFTKRNVRYTGDITDKDTFQTAWRTLQMVGGDCFPLATTKIICRSKSTGMYELVRLGDLRLTWPMYEALSYSFARLRFEFQPITAFQDKGDKDVLHARLTTGTDLFATADHKFWSLDGQNPRHFKQNLTVRTLGEYMEVRSSGNKDLAMRRGRILQAARIPTLDQGDVPESLAYLAGIYAAEGYDDGKHVCISQYKPDVRAKIEQALADTGTSYRFQPPRGEPNASGVKTGGAYYALHTSEVKEALRAQGSNSFNMQLPMALLSGTRRTVQTMIDAYSDGDAYHPKPESRWFKMVTAVLSTSSDALAEQIRFGMLLLGRPYNDWLQRNHQGVGTKPIHRIHEYKSRTMLNREEVIRDVLPGMRYGYVQSVVPAGRDRVGCITVGENHNFVLADGTLASNCDDHSVLNAVLAMENGFNTRFRITSNTGATWDHIYALAGQPKNNPRRWIPLDTTLPGRSKFGVHPPMAKYKDFDVTEP